MCCILAKISHQADLEIYYFKLEHAIELYWWLRNTVLKIVSWGTYLIIMEFPRIFNVNLSRKCWLHCTQTWCANFLHTTYWFSAIIIFHGPNSFSLSKMRWEWTNTNAILSVQAMREIGDQILSYWLRIVNPYSL